uniref:Uncharacterized protein n=1 Tax=Arundo donax TaxID=35708 RepID=A0A0A9EDY9_ARUDO
MEEKASRFQARSQQGTISRRQLDDGCGILSQRLTQSRYGYLVIVRRDALVGLEINKAYTAKRRKNVPCSIIHCSRFVLGCSVQFRAWRFSWLTPIFFFSENKLLLVVLVFRIKDAKYFLRGSIEIELEVESERWPGWVRSQR